MVIRVLDLHLQLGGQNELGRALVCCGRMQDSTGLRLRGFIWHRATAWGQLVERFEGSLEPAEGSKGWQCILWTKFKHRLREGQTMHMGGPHNGSSELPAP